MNTSPYSIGVEERQTLNENFARVIENRGRELGFLLEEISARTGVPLERLRGEEPPTYPDLQRICEILFPGTHPSELVGVCFPRNPSENLLLRYYFMVLHDLGAP